MSDRFPTARETRDDFFVDGRGQHLLAVRLTQTASSGLQVEIQELAEFYEELKWVLKETHGIPLEYTNIDAHDATITGREVRRQRIDEQALEADIEALAAEYDIALAKRINLSRYPQKVFIKYLYGWGESASDTMEDPHSPHARTEWVGGERGRPETLSPNPIKITAVESQ